MLRAAKIHATQVPMKKAFVHARAARVVADNLIMTVDIDGHTGIGESVPRDYVTGETIESAFQAISDLDFEIFSDVTSSKNLQIALAKLEELNLPSRLMQGKVPGLAASCAVELAMLDALGKKFSVPLSQMTRNIVHSQDMLQATYMSPPLTRTFDYDTKIEKRASDDHRHFTCVKIKVGRDDDEDVERVAAARSLFGDLIHLSVDVNMGWSYDQAERMANKLKTFRVSWYEQPFPIENLAECSRLRKKTGVKILLDESLCSMDQAKAAVKADACDMFNLRISKCGGFIGTLRLAEFARENSLGYILGGHPGQNSILTAAERAFASFVRNVVSCEALFTTANLTELFSKERMESRDFDWESSLSKPGLGITPDLNKVEKSTLKSTTLI